MWNTVWQTAEGSRVRALEPASGAGGVDFSFIASSWVGYVVRYVARLLARLCLVARLIWITMDRGDFLWTSFNDDVPASRPRKKIGGVPLWFRTPHGPHSIYLGERSDPPPRRHELGK